MDDKILILFLGLGFNVIGVFLLATPLLKDKLKIRDLKDEVLVNTRAGEPGKDDMEFVRPRDQKNKRITWCGIICTVIGVICCGVAGVLIG